MAKKTKKPTSILTNYCKAGFGILYFVTPEEHRAERECLKAAKDTNRQIATWSCTEGLKFPLVKDKNGNGLQDREDDDAKDPTMILEMIKETEFDSPTIFVLRDFHNYFDNALIKRQLRDIARDFKQQKKNLILLSPVNALPKELEHDVTLIELEMPGPDQLQKLFESICEHNELKVDEAEKDKIVQASRGLTIPEAEAAFGKAFVDRASYDENEDKPEVSDLVMQEKANAVKKSGILEYFDTKITQSDIGGLDNLKNWLSVRSLAFSKEAREFGLPMPRGVLLVGLPGCGKSLTAKAASSVLRVPLIRFDVGRVFGGIVGESESNMRLAIQTVEALGACVVWIDEMEKAFSGLASSGQTDSGVTARVFGSFITWMQEKKTPSFIIATVNNQEVLPPEMLRKGRFDEIFFVGLPTVKEREEIFRIHIRRKGRDPKNFNIETLARVAKEFSGAEIEEAINSGLFQAFHTGTQLDDDHIIQAIKSTRALARTRQEQIKKMADWASVNAVQASTQEQNVRNNKGKSGPAAIQLE